MEILLQMGNFGISDIRSVEEGKQVENAKLSCQPAV
jgi:hypothetical protein